MQLHWMHAENSNKKSFFFPAPMNLSNSTVTDFCKLQNTDAVVNSNLGNFSSVTTNDYKPINMCKARNVFQKHFVP